MLSQLHNLKCQTFIQRLQQDLGKIISFYFNDDFWLYEAIQKCAHCNFLNSKIKRPK